ncbi:Domain of unknown function DUF1844 [Anaeromyxobacter dehalogenans 2CP-1]|uniref:DUF1844 domain-containing protein n=1 Tax=Anaeromyxobacter dehalogenans (strain ATCC BAA-258 / DSM 21875 / 2CP-1) TaxID=455488 RepID=B8J7V7_ANAD2|nr:DUF1844 domain-containing protein [Anaeromyxobacter dehalogenans]ACL63449.1 Domain of unknown function DUF1844 [Anaeromyxobacter dehalogenans 2CP-1]
MADEKQPAPIDFYTFVLSLGSSAFVHLGDAPHPETGEIAEANLLLAKQTIDILSMLAEKTKGNLTDEEARFLENLLTDLRLRYVGKSSGR